MAANHVDLVYRLGLHDERIPGPAKQPDCLVLGPITGIIFAQAVKRVLVPELAGRIRRYALIIGVMLLIS